MWCGTRRRPVKPRSFHRAGPEDGGSLQFITKDVLVRLPRVVVIPKALPLDEVVQFWKEGRRKRSGSDDGETHHGPARFAIVAMEELVRLRPPVLISASRIRSTWNTAEAMCGRLGKGARSLSDKAGRACLQLPTWMRSCRRRPRKKSTRRRSGGRREMFVKIISSANLNQKRASR